MNVPVYWVCNNAYCLKYFAFWWLPIFMLSWESTYTCGHQSHLHGFFKNHDITCTQLTTLSSLASPCSHIWDSSKYDILSNIALSSGDSSTITNHGVQVDPKSLTGLFFWNKHQTLITKSVDCHEMVRRLSASQEEHIDIILSPLLPITASFPDSPLFISEKEKNI